MNPASLRFVVEKRGKEQVLLCELHISIPVILSPTTAQKVCARPDQPEVSCPLGVIYASGIMADYINYSLTRVVQCTHRRV